MVTSQLTDTAQAAAVPCVLCHVSFGASRVSCVSVVCRVSHSLIMVLVVVVLVFVLVLVVVVVVGTLFKALTEFSAIILNFIVFHILHGTCRDYYSSLSTVALRTAGVSGGAPSTC